MLSSLTEPKDEPAVDVTIYLEVCLKVFPAFKDDLEGSLEVKMRMPMDITLLCRKPCMSVFEICCINNQCLRKDILETLSPKYLKTSSDSQDGLYHNVRLPLLRENDSRGRAEVFSGDETGRSLL